MRKVVIQKLKDKANAFKLLAKQLKTFNYVDNNNYLHYMYHRCKAFNNQPHD